MAHGARVFSGTVYGNVGFPHTLDNNKLSFFFIFAGLIAEDDDIVTLICISLISREAEKFPYNY